MILLACLAALPLLASPQAAPPATPTEGVAPGADTRPDAPRQIQGMPKVPTTPAAVLEVVASVPFVLDKPYQHGMRKVRHEVTRGHVLVLRCDPRYLLRRQTAEPVLVAGAETAERINIGFDAGVLVTVVPEWREKGADGIERPVDPLTTPIYFATPELPERVDAAWIAAEAVKARAAGIAVPPIATDARSPERRFADRDALNRFLADLVERHAPGERECAAALRGLPPE